MRGESFLYPSAVTRSCATSSSAAPGEQQFDVLTPRELEVLKLIAEAHTSKEIAESSSSASRRSSATAQNILEKLGMRDRVELTRYAIRRGLIQP